MAAVPVIHIIDSDTESEDSLVSTLTMASSADMVAQLEAALMEELSDAEFPVEEIPDAEMPEMEFPEGEVPVEEVPAEDDPIEEDPSEVDPDESDPEDSPAESDPEDSPIESDSEEDDLGAEEPVHQAPSIQGMRFRYDGVIPGVNGGRAFIDEHGIRRRITARKRVVPISPIATTSDRAIPAEAVPTMAEMMEEIRALRNRVSELEDQTTYLLDQIHPSSD